MSISSFQDKFLGKGCGTAIAVVMALAFVGLMFSTCGRGAGQNQDNAEVKPSAIVNVGPVAITADSVDKAAQQDASQGLQPGAMPTYEMQATAEAYALNKLLQDAALQVIAAQDHIQFTDDALMQAGTAVIDQQLMQAQMQLMMSGQIKPTATPAQIDAAFLKLNHQTPAQMKATAAANLKRALADTTQRGQLAAALAPAVVLDAVIARDAPTAAQLKADFNTYVIKRILVAKKRGSDPAQTMAHVQAALKGGMSFEAAMDKYSDDPPQQKGKPKSQATISLPAALVDSEPEYKAVAGQAPGFISPVTTDPAGEIIYKLVEVRNTAPKDLETNRAKYVKQFAQAKAQKDLQAQVTAVLASLQVKWASKGYKALYDYTQAAAIADPAARQVALQNVVTEAQTQAQNGAAADLIPATYALYDASTALYQTPGADKSKLIDDRIKVLSTVLQTAEDYTLRMELVDLYIQKKDGSDALTNLVSAASANTTYDATGQQRFGDLTAKALQLSKLGLVKQSDLAAFNAAQASWRTQMQAQNDQNAQMQAAQAQEKIQALANEKANAEAVKKQQEQIGTTKSTVPPSSGLLPKNSAPSSPSASGSLIPPTGQTPTTG